MKGREFYNAAVYLRLSRDDISAKDAGDKHVNGDEKRLGTAKGSGRTESNSISSQRDMIRSFIRKQDNMVIMISMWMTASPGRILTGRSLSG